MTDNKYFYNQILKTVIGFFLFYLVFQLNFYRHWSSISDQDLIIIHNSLLLNSGLKAEYHDHPGHTLIYLLSIWLEILNSLSLVSFSSYDDIQNVENLEKDFTKVVIFARLFNFFISFSIIYSISNILKLNKVERLTRYLLILSFIFSQTFLNSIGHIRTEMLSAGCIFLALLYFLKLINKDHLNRKYILLSGFFVSLSIFCKWQSIFIFVFFPFIILIYKKKKIITLLKNFELRNIHLYLNLFFLVGIGFLCKKYMHGLNFIIIPFTVIFFIFFIFVLNKRYFKNKNFLYIFLFYFLSGIGLGFIALIVFKPFHTNNIGMVLNFIGTGNMFISSENPYNYKFSDILELLILSIKNIDYYIAKILSNRLNEIFIFLLFLYIFLNNFNKKNITIFIHYIFILFFIIAIFSTRPQLNYTIYIAPIMYIFFGIINISNKNIFNTLISLIIIFNFVNSFEIIQNHKLITEYESICDQINLNKKNFFWDRMSSDIFINICK